MRYQLWIFCTIIKYLIIFAQNEAAARVEYIFNLLDTNRDGEISLEEFLQGCLEDKDLTRLLK